MVEAGVLDQANNRLVCGAARRNQPETVEGYRTSDVQEICVCRWPSKRRNGADAEDADYLTQAAELYTSATVVA